MLLREQRALDGLLFARRALRDRLCVEEWILNSLRGDAELKLYHSLRMTPVEQPAAGMMAASGFGQRIYHNEPSRRSVSG